MLYCTVNYTFHGEIMEKEFGIGQNNVMFNFLIT